MKWLNIAGLTLQFISFWLAAPELLGKSTLQRMEQNLLSFFSLVPNIVLLLIVCTFSFSMAGYGIYKGIEGAENGMSGKEVLSIAFTLILASLVYAVFLYYYKRIKGWLEQRIAIPLTNTLIEDQHIRQTSLKTGALLFSMGFIFQLVALLFS